MVLAHHLHVVGQQRTYLEGICLGGYRLVADPDILVCLLLGLFAVSLPLFLQGPASFRQRIEITESGRSIQQILCRAMVASVIGVAADSLGKARYTRWNTSPHFGCKPGTRVGTAINRPRKRRQMQKEGGEAARCWGRCLDLRVLGLRSLDA